MCNQEADLCCMTVQVWSKDCSICQKTVWASCTLRGGLNTIAHTPDRSRAQMHQHLQHRRRRRRAYLEPSLLSRTSLEIFLVMDTRGQVSARHIWCILCSYRPVQSSKSPQYSHQTADLGIFGIDLIGSKISYVKSSRTSCDTMTVQYHWSSSMPTLQ